MLKSPRVQNKQQIGRLSECGQAIFASSETSPSTSFSWVWLTLKNLGRDISTSMTGSATELEPVLDAMETGLEFLDEANELGSDGKHALDLWILCGTFGNRWTGALAGRLSCWWWAMIR